MLITFSWALPHMTGKRHLVSQRLRAKTHDRLPALYLHANVGTCGAEPIGGAAMEEPDGSSWAWLPLNSLASAQFRTDLDRRRQVENSLTMSDGVSKSWLEWLGLLEFALIPTGFVRAQVMLCCRDSTKDGYRTFTATSCYKNLFLLYVQSIGLLLDNSLA